MSFTDRQKNEKVLNRLNTNNIFLILCITLILFPNTNSLSRNVNKFFNLFIDIFI